MIPDLTPRISQKPDPRDSRRLTLRIWAVLFPALWIVHALLPLPAYRPIDVWLEGLLAATLTLGVAVLVAMIILTRHRIRSVFRPTRANLVGGGLLGLLAPFGVVGGVPWIAAGLLAFVLGSDERNLAAVAFVIAIPAVVCYPIASLLVAGTNSRWWRFAMFCLIWWSAYAAHVLVFNIWD